MHLQSLNLHLTNRCNLLCEHCLYSSGEKEMDEMSTQEVTELMNQFRAIAGEAGTVNLFGGEPLLRKDIFEIIASIRRLGLHVGMTTNIAVNDARVRKLASSGVSRISIDLHGKDGEMHDWIRAKSGHFQRSVNTIRMLIEAGKEVSANCALHLGNIHDVEAILSLGKELGIYSLSFYLFSPVGRGQHHPHLLVDAQDWMAARARAEHWINDHKPSFAVIWERSYEHRDHFQSLPLPMCHGQTSDAIDVRCDGNVYFCGLLMSADRPLVDRDAHSLGNVRHETLSAVLARRQEKAFCLTNCCPALALHHTERDRPLRDPRTAHGDILPTCPYDWFLLSGKERDYKERFAHINNQPYKTFWAATH